MTTTITTAELQDLIASGIIDDVCDFNPRFVGRDDLAAELANECCRYIDEALQSNGYLMLHGTARQKAAAASWGPQVRALIYTRLDVRG